MLTTLWYFLWRNTIFGLVFVAVLFCLFELLSGPGVYNNDSQEWVGYIYLSAIYGGMIGVFLGFIQGLFIGIVLAIALRFTKASAAPTSYWRIGRIAAVVLPSIGLVTILILFSINPQENTSLYEWFTLVPVILIPTLFFILPLRFLKQFIKSSPLSLGH